MRRAEELNELSVLTSEYSKQLQQLKETLESTVERIYNEMNDNPDLRQKNRKAVMEMNLHYNENAIRDFAIYAKEWGYYVYKDGLSMRYEVHFAPNINGNPYRKLVLDDK